MTQLINPTAGDPATILLLNAMAAMTDDKDDIIERFGIVMKGPEAGKVSVQVLVNGVEIPYQEAFKVSIKQCLGGYEDHVKKKAMELLKEHPLTNSLYSLMNTVDYELEQIIDGIRKSI